MKYVPTQSGTRFYLINIFCDSGNLGQCKLKSSMWIVTGNKDNIGHGRDGVRRNSGSPCSRRQVEIIGGPPLRNCVIYGLQRRPNTLHSKSLDNRMYITAFYPFYIYESSTLFRIILQVSLKGSNP